MRYFQAVKSNVKSSLLVISPPLIPSFIMLVEKLVSPRELLIMFPESGCPPAGKNSIPHHTAGIQLVQGNLQRPGQRWCMVPLQRDSRLMPETQNYLHGFHLFFCFKTLQGLLFQSSAFLFCLFGFLLLGKKALARAIPNTPEHWGVAYGEHRPPQHQCTFLWALAVPVPHTWATGQHLRHQWAQCGFPWDCL